MALHCGFGFQKIPGAISTRTALRVLRPQRECVGSQESAPSLYEIVYLHRQLSSLPTSLQGPECLGLHATHVQSMPLHTRFGVEGPLPLVRGLLKAAGLLGGNYHEGGGTTEVLGWIGWQWVWRCLKYAM